MRYGQAITVEQAKQLYKSNFWESMSDQKIVTFQLFEKLLCMPFDVFHKAIEKVLKRPIYTHEFGLNIDGIKREVLGTDLPPTIEDIINLIPEEKRIVIFI